MEELNSRIIITTGKAGVVMNSNSEFHQAPISRIRVTTGLELDQEKEVVWGSRGRGSDTRYHIHY